MKLLLEHGARPDIKLLSRAVERGCVPVVQLLLAGGAKADYKYKTVSHFKHISIGFYWING